MSEPQVICPKCNHEIPLTELLAAPLLELTRREFRDQLATKDAEYAKKAELLLRQQEELARTRETIEEQIAERIKVERAHIVAIELKKAKEAVAADLEAKETQLAEVRELLKQNDAKLADAQTAQASVLRKERELDAAKRELDLTIERRVQATQAEILAKARQDAEDALKSQVSQKELQIAAMARTIEDLKRKAEQGSQQNSGRSPGGRARRNAEEQISSRPD